MKRSLFCWLSLLLFTVLPAALFADQADPVLIIHSYHPGFLWTDTIEAGIRRGFELEEGKYELYTEYFDTKRFPPAERAAAFTDYLSRKYRNIEFSLLIVSDDNAYNYALDQRDGLFREIPVVFCGLNNFDTYPGDRPAGVTGIAEDFDVTANLELIASIHGEQSLVAVVADGTPTGTLNLGRFALAAEAETAPKLQYEILFDLNTAELQRRLAMLPEDTIILNLGFYRDSNNRALNNSESISLLAEPGFPIYTCWDYMIRFGAVGGIAIDGGIQGEQAARYALEILHGTRPEELPVRRRDLTKPIFDYRALKAHTIRVSRLPRERVIRNLPNRIYFRYPVAFTVTVSLLAVLSLLVILLILNILLRKQAEKLFRSLFESVPDVILVHDFQGRILLVNPAVERVHGYRVEEALGMKIQDLDTPDAATYPERLKNQIRQVQGEYEVAHTGSDGRRLEFESSFARVSFHGKEAILAVLRDITERKQTERHLEASAREKETLLKEIHHRVKNNLQIIVSLLRLQSDSVNDPVSEKILINSQNRISAMAAVHEMLYRSTDLASIPAPEYLEALTDQLNTSYEDEKVRIQAELVVADFNLSVDQAIPLGIITTELITNSLKYGKLNGECRYHLSISIQDEDLIFRYRDFGPGFEYEKREKNSLGLELVETLTRQLDGNLSHDGGSEFTLIFPYIPR